LKEAGWRIGVTLVGSVVRFSLVQLFKMKGEGHEDQ
jgi:hypothetical protein